MKTRTCPHCNHKYTFKETLTKVPAFGFIKVYFNCVKCSKSLQLNKKRRKIVFVLSILLGFSLIIGIDLLRDYNWFKYLFIFTNVLMAFSLSFIDVYEARTEHTSLKNQ